jgi:GT2 family glycosyltransferase
VLDQPSVTIIVLNYNGLKHLQDCFSSLTKLDYPADRLELMVVDNASTDGSVAYMQSQYPHVRLVVSPDNVGFAAGNNLGTAAATGQYIVFLNNDMWVEPRFVHGLVQAVQSGPDVVCASAKILNWDGSEFDFAGAFVHFAGHAYQEGIGKPYTPEQFAEIRPILFACGGAMIIDRQIFLQTGGFDEDYFIYFEDVDLGWRLWLLGHSVVFAPDAIVYHRHHGTMKSFSDYRKRVLYKRNALYSVIKNYSDENLGKILPAILMASVDGVVGQAVQRGQLDLDEFFIKNPHKPLQSLVSFDKGNVSTLVAISEVVEHLPQVLEKRRFVQAHRQRSDKEVAPLFRRPFRSWPDISLQSQYWVADAFELQSLFEHLPRRVLIISPDILPYPGMPTVGSGLRAWGLGQGLKSCGHEVLFSMPRMALNHYQAIAPPEAADLAWEPNTLAEVVQQAEADVIIVCSWWVLGYLPTAHAKAPIVLDQAGPHYLERQYQKAGDPEEDAQRKLDALRKADFFTCSGQKQFAYFESWLERAGWTEQERRERTGIIPFSLPPELPEHQPNGELTFVYGGMFLPWQDPSASLAALVEMLEQRNCGKLHFFGGKHPIYEIDSGIFQNLLAQLQKSSRVITSEVMPYDDLIAEYTRAHVAIDLMKRNSERELAFTTRTVGYLWCGLPVIYNDYAELSDYIREYNAGWTVNPEDNEALTQVLNEIFEHPEQVLERGRNAQRLVFERLNWNRTIQPLDAFIRHPRLRQHDIFKKRPPTRNTRYLLDELARHYRRGGLGTLWQESWAFLRRQTGFF